MCAIDIAFSDHQRRARVGADRLFDSVSFSPLQARYFTAHDQLAFAGAG